MRLSSRGNLLLNFATSLDELTRYDTNLHLNLIAISNICSHYQERKVDNETLSELPALKAWEKTRIEDVIRRAEKLEPDDAPQLVNVLKRPGTDLVNGQYVRCFAP